MALWNAFMIIIFSESEIWLVQRSGLQDSGNPPLLQWLTEWSLQVSYLVSCFSHLQIGDGNTGMLDHLQKGMVEL